MGKYVILAGLFLVWSFTGLAAAGDEVTDLADKAKQAYAAGNYQEALDLFQQVVQRIQAMVSQSFERFMPKAQAGWEAGEIESQSWSGTTGETSQHMTNLSCEYTREKDEAECTVNIANWPHLIQGYRQTAQMYKQMGDMLNADPDTKISVEETDGWVIIKVVEVADENVQVTAVHDDLMVNIEFDRNEPDVAASYLKSIDLAGLVAAAK